MTDEMRKEVMSLTKRLLKDLKSLGLSPHTLNYQLELRDYSKRYFGRYTRQNHYGECICKVFIYLFRNKYCVTLYEYPDILSTAVHEICHHIQHEDPDFVRRKGVMHDKQFWELYNTYMNRYYELNKSAKKGDRYFESLKKTGRCNK